MRHLLAFLVCIFFLVSCNEQEVGTPFRKGQEVTLSAGIANQRPQMLPRMQRISGKDTDPTQQSNDGIIQLTWDKGDAIKVIVGEGDQAQSANFTLVSGEGTGEGVFTGVMPADGSSFHVQYPILEPNLREQVYVKDGFGKDLMRMTTRQEGTLDDGFSLSATDALLGLQLTGDREIGKIVLSKNEADGKAGDTSYTLLCPNVILSSTPTLFYIVVPAGTWDNGFTVEVFAKDNNMVLDTFVRTSSISFLPTDAAVMPEKEVQSVPEPCMVVKVNDTISINMMCVEGGTFKMGSDAPGAEADEQPVHEVTLSDYYIGQTEVTQHLWKAVMGDENNPSATKGNNLPVTNISWDEAQVFVERLSELTGMHFRLPTEAEWEYAARGGRKSKGYTYAGSDDIDEVGWYASNSDNKTHSVGQKLPNELGMYAMTGNVWEYCYDWHMPYSAQAQTNPTGAATGEKRVLRGGCYHYDPKNCTNTNRHSYYTPDKGGASTGLRIVLEPEKHYRYGYTQEDWDAATSSWGHGGRGHAHTDQSCIQGTMVYGIRLKVARGGSLNVYKVPSLLEKTEDHFELVATLTTTTTGVQDFDFEEPIYIAPNEYLVFGKPSEAEPTLRPCYINIRRAELPAKAKGFAHYIGTEKAKVVAPNGSLMVEFY